MQMNLKNRKLLKEWKKIENTDLFKSLEDFAVFYYTNSEKFCYKKFTNEEWTKDNFFFGTYEELLEFYKTDTTIPYSAQQKVGQKFHSLTVLELFAENKTGKKVIYAKCKCDCGNDTIKILRDVVKGDACTCGCRTGGKEPKVTKPLTVELIEFWDFNKNADIDPYKISQMSTEKFWWKDKEGNSYQLAPYVFAKEDKTHSSFPEQALFYYIKKEYSSAINRANFITADGEVLEIDIYIPTYNIGIEYDGLFWHKDKAETDTYKSNVLFENGVYLIRIRENGLPDLNVNDFIINQSPYNSTNEREFVETINKVLNEINDRTNKIGNEKLSYENFIQNRNSIYAQFYNKPVKNSIKDTCISRFWDKERNGSLTPELINETSTLPIYFKCSAGHSFKLTAKSINEKFKKFKRYACGSDINVNANSCNFKECCPFCNLYICDSSYRAKCLSREGFTLPTLYCSTSNIFLETKKIKKKDSLLEFYDFERNKRIKKIKKSLLNFSFINNSAFAFYFTNNFRAFLFKGTTINREYNYGYFLGKWYDELICSMQSKEFQFYITDDLFSRIANNTLIIFNRLFKDEYMRGWRFVIFLIIEFDEKGNVKKQYSKIYSGDDLNSDFLISDNKELEVPREQNNIDILISKLIKHIH